MAARMTYRDVLIHRRNCDPDQGQPLHTGVAPTLLATLEGFTPMGAPRSNARTHFGSGKDAARVKKYHEYRDAIASRVLTCLTQQTLRFSDFTGHLGLVFRFPVPASWSMRKQIQACQFGEYHRQKPDVDNLVKGFLDAVMDEDCQVADVRAVKVWAPRGQEGVQVWRLPQWV
jgi:Holliday junction resolvase RusA-like endonuclease